MFRKLKRLLSLTLAFLILFSSQQMVFGKTSQPNYMDYNGKIVAIVTPIDSSESNQSPDTSKEASGLYSLGGVTFDGTQSGWAEPELEAAYNYGLTYPGVMNNFRKKITREEFCIIVVKLYEKLAGKTAVAGNDPFKDTSNTEILKAYNLGIVKGTSVSGDVFEPAANITREQICTMIYRAIDAALPSPDMSAEITLPFTDVGKIHSWALVQMKFAYKNEIMKGYSATEIAPLENTNREQAIALLKRTYEKFSAPPDISNPPDMATIPVKNPPAQKENALKGYAWMREGSAFIPKFDQRIELFVSTIPGKPTQKPVSPKLIADVSDIENNNGIKLFAYNGNSIFDESFLFYGRTLQPITIIPKIPILPKIPTLPDLPVLEIVKPAPTGPYYTAANFGAFIDQSGDRKRWFAYKLKNASDATKVVWQVSTVPFSGKADNWKSSDGLVKSGEVAASAGEFLIDFGNLNSRISSKFKLDFSNYKPIPQAQKTYYVRSVPVNSSGAPIGDPGTGIAVVYGKQAKNSFTPGKFSTACELWTVRSYSGVYNGEFQDRPKKYGSTGVSPKDLNNSKLFNFNNLDPAVTQIVIQISEQPFLGMDTWPSGKKLLYEKSYTVPVTTAGLPTSLPDSFLPSVLVPFTQFGKPAAEMVADEFIKYYVRGVVLKPSQTPGMMDAAYTNIVTVDYGFGAPIVFYSPPAPKYEYINRSLPSLQIKAYEPIKWAASDYLQHYYIYRQPVAGDITSCWMNSDTKEVLYPYDDYFGKLYYKAQGITTAQQYEQIVIPRVLKAGYKVYFAPPVEKDEEWYEELYNGVVEFFEDLVHIASEIVNQVSSAYNGLKSGLINFVAENLCPIPALRGAFKAALEGLVNYGLIAVGLPPTLPDFKDLSSMSLEYLAEVALTEAGIPENDLTKYAVDEIKDAIGKEIEKASNYADVNPVNAAFLKLDPEFCYRPAYIDVEISNNSPYASVGGSFNLDVTFEFDYYNKIANSYDPYDGITYTCDNPYIPGSNAALSTSSAYMDHFDHGLNGDTVNFKNGETAIYDVFNPIRGQKVPVLKANETTLLRVYLSPYGFCGGANFARYPTGDNLHPNDFDVMYFGNGNKKFNHFYLTGQFPSALEFMNSNGKTFIMTDPEAILTYKSSGPTSDTAKEKPVKSAWSK